MRVRRAIMQVVNHALGKAGLELRRAATGALGHDAFADKAFLLGQRATTPLVLDAGAHHGNVTDRYRQIWPRCTVHCFEPSDAAFDALVRRHGNRDGIFLNNAAISNEKGEKSLFRNRLQATNSLLKRPESGKRYYPRKDETLDTVNVTVRTIDEYCSEMSIDCINVLKMDIQGAEVEALRGAEGMLSNCAVDLVYTEVAFVPHYQGQPMLCDLVAELQRHGYSLYNLYSLVRAEDGQIRYGDGIFVSPQVRARL